ncbi:SCO-spondin-like [Anneissia japonica]|uniref:SCO-spondin-like n=1 Tax=Anneissia japonica TaxID=1529436 RepID=UPI00142572AF|nr:SCO-spondin-like [Anneissia japonica]XP_033097218.1 SCO-spondin-like [Anneissia japonica]
MKIILATVICLCILEIALVDGFWGRRRRRRRRSCSAVNCAWSGWQEWGACSITCGNNGEQTRIRTQSRSASCGGSACTGPSQEQRVCSPGCIRGTAVQGRCANCPFPYTGNCCERRSCYPVNCAWGNWQEWGACSITCGNGGTERRSRTKIRSASCGGAACTGSSQEQKVCSPGCSRGTAVTGYCANCPFPYTGNCCEQFIEGDPCTTHIELSQSWRSINYPPEQDNSYHYANLLNYWYRFVGGGGGDMPTKCVKAKSCGVLKPIWMSGDHPTSNEGAVCRTVCTSASVNGEDNCCIGRNTIEVKNCADNFYVYKLFQPQDCNEGFCAGKEEPCPPKTKSPNGYTPDCMADPPPDTCRPTPFLEYRPIQPQAGAFQFVCTFNVPCQRNITYDVNWYAGGIVLNDFAISVSGSTTGATLGVQQLASVMTTSTTITCSLSVRYIHTDDGTPMSEATSPKESNALAFVVT